MTRSHHGTRMRTKANKHCSCNGEEMRKLPIKYDVETEWEVRIRVTILVYERRQGDRQEVCIRPGRANRDDSGISAELPMASTATTLHFPATPRSKGAINDTAE